MLQQMLRQLPSKTEMPELHRRHLADRARRPASRTNCSSPAPETPKEFYAEKPIQLRMVGTYHQFGAFISGVASLPRVVILTMHDISLKPAKATGAGVQRTRRPALAGRHGEDLPLPG